MTQNLQRLIREFNHTWMLAAVQAPEPDPVALADICKQMIFDLTGEAPQQPKRVRHYTMAPKLREAGFSCLPRWWVSDEHFDLVKYMADQDFPQVQAIRLAHKESFDE